MTTALPTGFILLSLSFRIYAIGDWRPMGQGDPLIDPTHVYSPPHVQHVHYWLKAPSLSLEPPPSRVSGLSQVVGWPQVTSHYLSQPERFISLTTTPVSITTLYPEPPSVLFVTSPTPTTTTSTTPKPTTVSTTTTTTTSTSSPPLTFVIEGHSKVKTFGPLPESTNSIHNINHNHLVTTLFKF